MKIRPIIALFALSSMLFSMDALIDTASLEAQLKDPKTVIVDVSERTVYEKGHIPGAINTAINEWRSHNGTYLILHPIEQIQALMRRLGIDNDSKVVIYTHITSPKDFLKASYIYWAMDYLGAGKIALLDGGYEKWIGEKRASSTKGARAGQGDFTANVKAGKLADADYVKSHIGKLPMLDARPTEFYFGMKASSGVKRKGHIKEATSYPWNYSVDSHYIVKPAEELRAIFEEGFGLMQDDEIIVYCTGGLETSYNYFILSGLLGYKNVRLYDASMKEWGNRDDTPMTIHRWE